MDLRHRTKEMCPTNTEHFLPVVVDVQDSQQQTWNEDFIIHLMIK